MSEKEFEAYLAQNPDLVFDAKSGTVRRRDPKIDGIFANSQCKSETKKEIKSSKYWNIKVYEYQDGFVSDQKNIDGHGKLVTVYDSLKEYRRWSELQLLQKAGQITNLERQKTLLIEEGGVYRGEKLLPITYKADFVYEENGETVVEDVKGVDSKTGQIKKTKDFVLKWKLLKKRYPEFNFKIY